jgi:signal peptidase II
MSNRNYGAWYHDSSFWTVFFVDLISKRFISTFITKTVVIIPRFLKFGVVYNRGVAWSLFHGNDQLTFVVLSTVIFAVLCFLAKYTLDLQKEGNEVFGETLVLAGGFSNFVDRLRYGGVLDFIHVSFGNYNFPVFNLADIAITFGVIIILYNFFMEE